jgi:tetratricopeptide (TPR) repeat protein
LTARGLLKQELGLADAVDDLQQAVADGAAVVWPYAALARYALQQGKGDQAIELCQRGLALAQHDRVKAILFELRAIALFQLRDALDSLDAVRAAFQTAAELDPLSEQIQLNRQRFEAYAESPHTGEPQWELAIDTPGAGMSEIYEQLQLAA